MASVYIHIPFCLKKCGYCDFFSVPVGGEGAPHAAYLEAVLRQLERDSRLLEGRMIRSVYFGGGTPSLMPPSFFRSVLRKVGLRAKLDECGEVTAEVNPATVGPEWFAGAKESGVTRVSIGVQSFSTRLLEMLGRKHTACEAMEAIALAQDAGFGSVSIDLIYAIADETDAELEEDLRVAMTFQTQHISAYALTLEDGTPMALRYRSPVDDDAAGLRQMRIASRMLSRGGWPRYEISNFAKPGFECLHNINYWRYGEYLGLGAGAASFSSVSGSPGLFGRRFTQVRDVSKYAEGSGLLADEEEIPIRTAMGEFLFMGLRMMEGVSCRRFEELFGEGIEKRFSREISELADGGLLSADGSRVALTQRGVELSNQVFSRFV